MDRRLGNVVFMGMGEPLANEAAVWAAVERIHDDIGLSARAHHDLHRRPRSRHPAPRPSGRCRSTWRCRCTPPTIELRDELVPINRRYPLDELMEACADYLAREGPAAELRMGADRRRQRPRTATLSSWPGCAGASACRPRQPDSAQPDARLPDRRHTAEAGARVPRLARVARRQRDSAPQPRHRHRRRVRPARRRPAGSRSARRSTRRYFGLATASLSRTLAHTALATRP